MALSIYTQKVGIVYVLKFGANFDKAFVVVVFHLDESDLPNPPSAAMSACFQKPAASASAIAKSSPEIYDQFSHICQVGSYLPNCRLRELVEFRPTITEIQILADSLAGGVCYVDTYKHIEGGSETVVVNQNLHLF